MRRPSLVELGVVGAGVARTLSGRIYEVLKRRILTGEIGPGENLREVQLCQGLKVSRTPLREALNRLAHEDLVRYRANVGYAVVGLSSEGFRRLQDLRMIVEPKVAALAALRAGEEALAKLRDAAVMPEVKEGDEGSFVAFCEANARFHLMLVEASGNPMLADIVMSSLDQYQRPAYLGIGRITRAGKATRCHKDIVDAIAGRDPMKAEAVMANHILGGHERIRAALEAAGY